MNSNHLKVVACITMLIDHIGQVFYPQNSVFVIIGRLSFPLFAFLIAQGYNHTKNINAYITRLLILGVISQPIYILIFNKNSLNIFFTLTFGLLSIWALKQKDNFLIQTIILILATILNVDYGFYGVLLITTSYLFLNQQPMQIFNFSFFNMVILGCYTFFIGKSLFLYNFLIQISSLNALIIIKEYDYKKITTNKWLKIGFYTFYPVHLTILYLIKVYFS